MKLNKNGLYKQVPWSNATHIQKDEGVRTEVNMELHQENDKTNMLR